MTDNPTQAFDVRVSTDGDGLLVVHGTEAYQLDGVAVDIWNWCDGEHSAGDIARMVAERYEVDIETARADSDAFLADMTRAGLLE